ncbi:unnamed protein product [Rotaria socialis]|uniref:Uncharacterized protein n=1 Tax=Rotaria socialis TaxID=392032 RepID=A0A818DS43_9BILA|nr:unnamed protein product [Rotaria socialis]CAF4771403.1 unnamed protein product [Rotaria socialis]
MSSLDTLASQTPQELRVKLMQHFGIAKEYEKNPGMISITYYCLMYIANEGLKLQKDKQFVSNVLDYLEATKRANPNDEIIKSMATGQATIEELISVLVTETNEAEYEESKTPEQLRLLMRKHYTVGGLADILSVFGSVKDDFLTLGKIAKSRAVAIFRELKSGASNNTAAKKPPDSNTDTGAHGISSEMSSSSSAKNFHNQTGRNQDIPFDVIAQAQKLFRYANSALEHEDISTAMQSGEEALELLRPYRH